MKCNNLPLRCWGFEHPLIKSYCEAWERLVLRPQPHLVPADLCKTCLTRTSPPTGLAFSQ